LLAVSNATTYYHAEGFLPLGKLSVWLVPVTVATSALPRSTR
jgi:hypothetical protein